MPCILGYFALNSTSHAFYFERQQWRRTTVATSSLLDQLTYECSQPASSLWCSGLLGNGS